MVEYRSKLKQLNLKSSEYNKKIEDAEKQLGIIPFKCREPVKLLYPNIERNCVKYKRGGAL